MTHEDQREMDIGIDPTTEQPRTIGAAIRRIRAEGKNSTQRHTGNRFERFVSEILPRLPQYQITEVYRFADWREREHLMGRDARDLGIDLVGKLRDGGYVAIQCKLRKSDSRIGPKDLGTFISDAAPTRSTGFKFAMLMLVCTASITKNAAEILHPRNGVWVNLLARHGNEPLNISEITRKHSPNNKQQEAIDKCVAGFNIHKRGRLIMACGTGKTFTSLKIAEALRPQPKRILFAAPSIALVGQARREWVRHAESELKCMIVCSDPNAGRGSSKDDSIELLLLDSPVTRHPGNIAKFLNAKDDATRVVFCTYHSLEKISAAQKLHHAPAFDIAFIDEAHRTTGVEKNAPSDKWSFQDIHSDDHVQTARRLYMTATQRIYDARSKTRAGEHGLQVYDMSDQSIYGPEFYRLKFRDAVNWTGPNGERMLCDYRVITLFMPRDMTAQMVDRLRNITDERGKRVGDLLKDLRSHCLRVYGVALALNGEIIAKTEITPPPMSRAIGFSNTIRNSKFYTAALNDPHLKGKVTRALASTSTPRKMNAEHLDASSDALLRTDALARLQNAADDDCEILSNVKLFSEGVDVPALDSIIFFEPRKSQVDVVQSVGRVMRYAPGKRFGYIIIPIAMEESESLEDMMKNQEGFDAIGKVLRALQSHDERLKDEIANIVIPAVPRAPVTTTYDVVDETEKKTREKTIVDEPVIPGLVDFAQGLQGVTDDILTQILENSGLSNTGRLNADEIKYAVETASGTLYRANIAEAIAKAIGDDSHSHTENKQEQEKLLKAACTIGALLMMNALLLHKRLTKSIRNLGGLNGLSALKDPIERLQVEWTVILERDYKPVFEPALAVLNALLAVPKDSYASKFIKQAICRLAERANEIADSISELGYDHAGPLYHRILGSADSDGAFYTTNNAALLLAQLALPKQGFADWHDEDAIGKLRIMDPACGTGTLLMAALKTIKDRALTPRSSDDKHIALHKALVENVFCGLDINHQAVQIAASNLALRAPKVDYRRINLYTMKHGIDADEVAHAGALELLRGDNLALITQPTDSTISQMGGQKVNGGTNLADDFPVKGLDMVIMNPPYSNQVKRSGKLGSRGKALMHANEKNIKQAVFASMGEDASDVISASSFSTFFAPLAEQLLNKDNSTLAMVMPVASCISVAALNKRRFIAENFHVERLITSHAKSGFSFSGNTDIHECLLIARRKKGEHPPTEITVLQRMPQNAADVGKLVKAIEQKKIGSWGAQHEWAAEYMQAGDWSPVQWFNGDLVQAVQSVKQNANLKRLGENHKITVNGMRVRTTFQKKECAADERDATPLFYSKSTKLRNTIHAHASEYRKPISGKEQAAQRLLNKGGYFLTATRVDTHSGLITAIYSPQPAIGSGWVPVSTPDQKTAQALAVWWNSTPAWLQLLNIRGTKLTWPMWSMNDLHDILIPDLSDENIATLAKAYEVVKNDPLCRMSEAADDPHRETIDRAAAAVSGISYTKIHRWRKLLAAEPTIRN